jgi:toxin CcdB
MQCDVHVNDDDASGQIPYLLDIQADLLSDLQTRVVVPLIYVCAFGRCARALHPQFVVQEQAVVLATHLIAAVRRQSLGPKVGSLQNQSDIVLAAIDILWSGV